MYFIKKYLALILSAMFALSFCSLAAEKIEVKKYEETYDAAKKLSCAIFIGDKTPKDKAVGVMVFIHGGSWVAGNKKQFYGTAKYFAERGFITVSPDYSLFNMHTKVTMEDMLDDIGHCIGYVKKRVAEMGYKTEKVALSGSSAGGHLTLLYAYSRKDTCPLKIAFVFEKTGPTEFRLERLIPDPKARDQVKRSPLATMMYGGPIPDNFFGSAEEEKTVARYSPLSHIDKNTVPTIAAYGGKDNTVRRIHRDALQQKLNECGVTNVFIDFPNSGHGMNADPEARNLFNKTVLEFAEKYF